MRDSQHHNSPMFEAPVADVVHSCDCDPKSLYFAYRRKLGRWKPAFMDLSGPIITAFLITTHVEDDCHPWESGDFNALCWDFINSYYMTNRNCSYPLCPIIHWSYIALVAARVSVTLVIIALWLFVTLFAADILPTPPLTSQVEDNGNDKKLRHSNNQMLHSCHKASWSHTIPCHLKPQRNSMESW